MGRPRDDRDAAQDLARELADLAAQLASMKGEAYNWLSAPEYAALRHRLEVAHASVEAAYFVRRRGLLLKGLTPLSIYCGCKEPAPYPPLHVKRGFQ
jgi:hypothetical protein